MIISGDWDSDNKPHKMKILSTDPLRIEGNFFPVQDEKCSVYKIEMGPDPTRAYF